ncbi:hypothetical protein NL676_035440 [Syzygium grande]|nr:hypothetical protein NL676_035440 [Syzygium grande]
MDPTTEALGTLGSATSTPAAGQPKFERRDSGTSAIKRKKKTNVPQRRGFVSSFSRLYFSLGDGVGGTLQELGGVDDWSLTNLVPQSSDQ